jgi:SAM-dependent methyltransferase
MSRACIPTAMSEWGRSWSRENNTMSNEEKITILTTPHTTYFADAENAGEMARLLKQARFATKGLGGLFPRCMDVSSVHEMLDLACGPGEWVLAVADAYPAMRVTGIDQSTVMVQFARSISHAIPTVSFEVMDVLSPLGLPRRDL